MFTSTLMKMKPLSKMEKMKGVIKYILPELIDLDC